MPSGGDVADVLALLSVFAQCVEVRSFLEARLVVDVEVEAVGGGVLLHEVILRVAEACEFSVFDPVLLVDGKTGAIPGT